MLYIIKNKFINYCKEKIAILLYIVGIKPNSTKFIDEKTIKYGYGQCYTFGYFEYNLPEKYINKNKIYSAVAE